MFFSPLFNEFDGQGQERKEDGECSSFRSGTLLQKPSEPSSAALLGALNLPAFACTSADVTAVLGDPGVPRHLLYSFHRAGRVAGLIGHFDLGALGLILRILDVHRGHAVHLCAEGTDNAASAGVAPVVGQPALVQLLLLTAAGRAHLPQRHLLREAEFLGASSAEGPTDTGVTPVHMGVGLPVLVQVALVVHALVGLRVHLSGRALVLGPAIPLCAGIATGETGASVAAVRA